MNINEEGKYYASMVRKFRTEYKSKNLQGFCRDQKVSYNKMLHCLRNDSYRKPKAEAPRVRAEQGLHPLVIDNVAQPAPRSFSNSQAISSGDLMLKDSRRVRMYYFHHSGEILTEKILHPDQNVTHQYV